VGDEGDPILRPLEQEPVAAKVAPDCCDAALAAAGAIVLGTCRRRPGAVAVAPQRPLEPSEGDLVQLRDDERRCSGPGELRRLARAAELRVGDEIDRSDRLPEGA
jgi:hypothetical protein